MSQETCWHQQSSLITCDSFFFLYSFTSTSCTFLPWLPFILCYLYFLLSRALVFPKRKLQWDNGPRMVPLQIQVRQRKMEHVYCWQQKECGFLLLIFHQSITFFLKQDYHIWEYYVKILCLIYLYIIFL